MKMYILILDDVPLGHAMNSAAHAGLQCYLAFERDADMQSWLPSFKKVTCKVSENELNKAIARADKYVIMTESALGGRMVGAAFAPREEWPDVFKHFQLYK